MVIETTQIIKIKDYLGKDTDLIITTTNNIDSRANRFNTRRTNKNHFCLMLLWKEYTLRHMACDLSTIAITLDHYINQF